LSFWVFSTHSPRERKLPSAQLNIDLSTLIQNDI
jgi:hypothetical protein